MKREKKVHFHSLIPEPVLPTIPIFSFEATQKFKDFNTKGKPSLYLMLTSLNLQSKTMNNEERSSKLQNSPLRKF